MVAMLNDKCSWEMFAVLMEISGGAQAGNEGGEEMAEYTLSPGKINAEVAL